MKDFAQRSRDMDAAFEELAQRLAHVPGVHFLSEWGGGLAYTARLGVGAILRVIIEPELHEDELWLHLSASVTRPKARVPTWDELRWCKDVFIGDRKAITVFPVRAEYVNHHPDVLHLFSPLERDPLPDFRRECTVSGLVSI
jgi:hypothetical protein